jgi:cytochrome c oxidase subunit 2
MPSQRSIGERVLAAAASLLALSPARADWQLNLPPGATEVSREIYDLHMMVLWVSTAIGALVFALLIYAMIAFRKKEGVAPATFDHSSKAEIVWTVIPVLILIALAIPSARTLVFIEDTRAADMTVKITGYQWKWNYEYLDEGVSFFSNLGRASNVARQRGSGIDPSTVDHYLLEVDRPLVLPAGVKIRYLVTASDVNHAWWVQDFGVKRDAIPGFLNEGWFQVDEPGIYRGQCAELCGMDHAFMPIVVEVLPKEEFGSWLAEQKAAMQSGQAPAAASSAGGMDRTHIVAAAARAIHRGEPGSGE